MELTDPQPDRTIDTPDPDDNWQVSSNRRARV